MPAPPPDSGRDAVAASASSRDHATASDTVTGAGAPGEDVTLRPDGQALATTGTFATGRLIGRFVLLGRIGRGGMGVVYLAYDPQLERRVALKVLHTENAGDDAGTARLLREAQALAQLAHPNVVAVHDVGRVDDGIYIAMEYIEGAVLGTWLRAQHRTWREIVAVFVAAAHGIAAAHDAGLVHRDIKPDNLMVGSDARVRVLDFGLARVSAAAPLASGLLGESGLRSLDVELTASRAVMGTPRYMAPEQFAGGVVDARTDIWAVCVSLWEALYDQRPFAGTTVTEICSNVTAGHIVPPRGRKIPRAVHRALLRGLAVDPTQRFADLRELIAELSKDRTQAVRRIMLASAAVGIAALGVAAGRGPPPCTADADVLAGTWDDGRRRELDNAFTAIGKAYAEDSRAVVTRTIDDYAEALLAARREACEATRVQGTQSEGVLERRMACLDRRMRYLGGLTQALATGDANATERAVESALGLPGIDGCASSERLLREPALPEDPTARHEAELLRGELEALMAQIDAGAFADVEVRIDDLDARAHALDHAPVLSEVLLVRGRWDARRGDDEAAAKLLAAALSTAQACGHDEITVEAATALALVEGGARFDVAEVYAAVADAVLVRMGDDAGLRVQLLTNVGQIQIMRGHHEQALETLSRALALVPIGHGETAGSTYLQHALAVALIEVGRHEEAEAVLATMLSAVEARVGPHHPDMAVALSDLSRLRIAQRRPEDALVSSRRARAVWVGAYGADHTDIATALNSEGRALSALGRDAEAERAYADALAIIEPAFGPEHPNVAIGLGNVAAVQIRLGRPQEAIGALERALKLRRARFGDDHDAVGKTLDLLGDALWANGDAPRAVAAWQQAIAMFERLGGPKDERIARGLMGLAQAAEHGGDLVGARSHLERALVLQSASAIAVERGDLRFALARVLLTADRPRALALAEQAKAEYREAGMRAAKSATGLQRWREQHE